MVEIAWHFRAIVLRLPFNLKCQSGSSKDGVYKAPVNDLVEDEQAENSAPKNASSHLGFNRFVWSKLSQVARISIFFGLRTNFF